MGNHPQDNKSSASLMQIFLAFAKIGAFTIGGGYAMMLMIQDEVTRRGWIEEKEFPTLLALSQAAPGLLAVNISIFTGYRLKGVKGSIVATLGSILPPFLIILIIAMAFTGIQDNPIVESIFKGIRPVVVALIAVPMIQMARNSNKHWWSWLVTAAAMGLTAFTPISPVYILLTSIIIAVSIAITSDRKVKIHNLRKMAEEKEKEKKKEEER